MLAPEARRPTLDDMLQTTQDAPRLLTAGDPHPVELVNPDGRSDFVLVCEHAGTAVPRRLRGLGLDAAEMRRHIAFDIGAEGLARLMAVALDAPLLLQRYSRLVIDCNRPTHAPDSIPEESDGTPIGANLGLSARERDQRRREIHEPFHQALARLLDERRTPILVAVHSFNPSLRNGPDRPWELGVLSNRDRSFATLFLDAFRRRNPERASAHNKPYVVDDLSDFTIPIHGERRGLPHALLEVRNDLIATPGGQAAWSALIAEALIEARAQPKERAGG